MIKGLNFLLAGLMVCLFCSITVLAASVSHCYQEEAHWVVVDDPDLEEGPSNWIINTDTDGGTVVRQTSNCNRQGSPDDYVGTMLIGEFNAGMDDYNWQLDVQSDDDDGWGAVIRYKDENNYYRFITEKQVGDFSRLEKCVDGKFYTLDEKQGSFEVGKLYGLRMSAYGDQIEVYLDNTLILSANDDTFSEGKFGIVSYGNIGLFANHMSVWS